jgi:hypothetical protein
MVQLPVDHWELGAVTAAVEEPMGELQTGGCDEGGGFQMQTRRRNRGKEIRAAEALHDQ